MEKKEEEINEGGLKYVSENEFTYSYRDIRGQYIVSKVPKGNLPGISVYADTIPGAWELAVLSVWKFGAEVPTHYDKSEDPPSIEATVTIEIADPFKEPRIHKYAHPGGIEKLEEYRQEVVEGIHDHHIKPTEGKWTYTYHERLEKHVPSEDLMKADRGILISRKKLESVLSDPDYKTIEDIKNAFKGGLLDVTPVNQIEKIIEDLCRDITSKGAQATTWMPTADPGLESNRPCLQRLWFRVLEDKDGEYVLNLNVDWRSRDEMKAWFMNVCGIIDIQAEVARRLSEKISRQVRIGTYRDKSDSLHIYGAYYKEKEFKKRIEEMKKNPDMTSRVWNTEWVADIFEEVREKLAKDPDHYLKGGK